MRRFSKFLMQACVCLFVATLTFAQTAHTSGEALLMASASENIARPDVMPVVTDQRTAGSGETHASDAGFQHVGCPIGCL